MFGEIFIIPLVLRTRGIINISPNTRAIFHLYFSNRVISYTYQEGEQLIAYNRNISGIILSTMHNAELRKDCGLIVSVQNKPNAP